MKNNNVCENLTIAHGRVRNDVKNQGGKAGGYQWRDTVSRESHNR